MTIQQATHSAPRNQNMIKKKIIKMMLEMNFFESLFLKVEVNNDKLPTTTNSNQKCQSIQVKNSTQHESANKY